VKARARGFFTAGSAGLALGGLLHLWGQFGGDDPPLARAAIEAAMRAYTIDAMGMTYSLMDVMQCWGVLFGVLAMFAGVQNLIFLMMLPRSARLGLLAASSGLCAAILLGVAIRYHVAPQSIVFGAVFLCFAAAMVLETRPAPSDH
jgi:hypothetical protein